MIILPRRRRRPPTGTQRTIGIGAAAAGVTTAIATATMSRGSHTRHSASPMATALALAGVVIVAAIVIVRARAGCGDDEPHDATGETGVADDDSRPQRVGIFIAIAAALAAIGLGIALYASKAHAQGAGERGVLYIRSGSDTIVTDRFTRTDDTLRGRSQVKGQPPIAYTAVLGAGNTIKTLAYDIYPAGARDGDKPAAHLSFNMTDDTAFAEVPSGMQRVPTKPGAIPMMPNMLALTELSTRRAKAAGGSLEVPWLVVATRATAMVSVNVFGSDSMSLRVGPLEQRFRIDSVGRILGGAIAGSRLEIVRDGVEAVGALTSATATATSLRDYSAPPGAPYTAEDVTVHTPGGFDLGGTLTKPTATSGRLPAVITITGSGQQDRDEYIPFAGGIRLFHELADTLSRRGMVVLRLDDRGFGASGGDFKSSTTADFADDIRAAVAYLRSRADIDPDRIALVGHSEGGVIAPMIAATDPKIHAIVILAGTSEPGIEISMGQNKYLVDHAAGLSQTQRDSILAAARVTLDPAKQTVPWLKFYLGYDPAVVLKQVHVPTLYIQGETDHQVPPAEAEMGAKIIRSNGNKDVTVRMFPATNHLFVPDSTGDITKYKELKINKIRPVILGAVADWLVVKLRK